jgi:hypothetical protein
LLGQSEEVEQTELQVGTGQIQLLEFGQAALRHRPLVQAKLLGQSADVAQTELQVGVGGFGG